MAQSEENPSDETTQEPAGLLGRLRGWVGGSKKRNWLVGVVLGVASLAVTTLWITATEIAAGPEEMTIDHALRALDDNDDALARSIVEDLQSRDELSASDYGGALFVLGALKSREAAQQWSADRARTDYFIASKYLEEGRSIGFPEGRDAQGMFLLGQALIESRQLEEGVEILNRAIEGGARERARAHLLLAEAHFFAPRPDYEATVAQVDAAMEEPSLTTRLGAKAKLLKAEALAALGRGAEALEAVRGAGEPDDPGRAALVEGKALFAMLQESTGPERDRVAAQANEAFARARRADKLATSVSRESEYLRARIADLVGDADTARAGYVKLWRSDGASPAGIAAALAEAELLQRAAEDTEALEAYRRALDAIGDPDTYRSGLAPLSEVRLRLRSAHRDYLNGGRFESALRLTDRVVRLLGPSDTLAMRANTLLRWGKLELEAAKSRGTRGRSELREGRRLLREAGITFERLAETRYATPQFIEDLWTAAEALVEGQAYEESIRVIRRYLRNEPVLRNATALLRMGEAHLARGEENAAIESFEECLEFHPEDAASFAARLHCARAYRERDDLDEAERLLRYNLIRTALTPASPEWRDSKFALGRLLAEAGRNDEAIAELEEAISRYTDDPQALWARYYVAMAHREAAREPLARFREAKTVAERELAREQVEEHLVAALDKFLEVQNEIIQTGANDSLGRTTLRNCFMLGGDVLFELGRYDEARQSFSNISTLYQNEPFMLEAFVHIYHCWRRERDRVKALGVVQQARLLLDRLPPDADFASSTNLTRTEWDSLLSQLALF